MEGSGNRCYLLKVLTTVSENQTKGVFSEVLFQETVLRYCRSVLLGHGTSRERPPKSPRFMVALKYAKGSRE